MPPRQDAKATLSRSRTNRVTHKTRLRVLVGRHDVEPIIDDDEAVDYHTHGVEAHESTEIHLQRSLSVTTLRALGGNVAGPSTSGASREKGSRKQQQQQQSQQQQQQHSVPAADAIPIPDASGIIDDTKLYPHGKFKETAIYIKFSDTVEESIASGLAATYTYYIDERDKAWLDKNNQAARGEGSSSQAARAAVAATAGASQQKRNGKAKEPEATHASSKSVEMSEDEFELVMGLFERRAADPPFVFSPDSFPSMDVYDEWFQTPLAAELFAAYSVPSSVPEPGRLLELAQTVYPHWKERRSERAYHHIIPQLSLDETMTNDSYACFRRRELRPVRRTRRQADAGVADPMLQLRKELNTCLDIAKLVAKREVQKRQQVLDTHAVADARLELAHLKRAHPVLGDRTDELLLFDKEPRPRKRKPTVSLSINTLPQKRTESIRIKHDTAERNSPATVVDRCTIAQQRIEDIASAVERDLSRLKQEDAGYEDGLDFPYQKPQIPAPQRLFKGPIGTGRLLASANRSQSPYAVRLRTGRGGRILMDRTARRPSELSPTASSSSSTSTSSKRSAAEAFDSDDEDDYEARMRERWQYDSDPLDTDPDANRVLVDDFSPALIRHRAMVTSSTDLQMYFNTSESHRFHDYRHTSMSGAPATSPSTHFSPGVRGSSTRRRGSMTRSGTMPPPRFIPGPSSGAVVGPGSGVPSHPATPTTPAPSSAGGVGAPAAAASATAQSNTSAVKQESQVSAASIVGRDPPSSPSPAGPASGVAAGPSSAAAAAALVTGRRNGVAVAPPLVPPLPPLSQPASTVGRQPAIKAGAISSSPGGNAVPAKGRLRLSDDGAPAKAPTGVGVGAGGAGSPASTQPNGNGRSRSKAAEALPMNGKGHGAGPPLQNRSNGHGPPKTNGNAATAPAVNGNGNGATLNGHHHNAHSKSRSPSTESARGATAASEAASAMSIDSES